jgi:RNA polymerase sigma-70 factor (ECF subfamily)
MVKDEEMAKDLQSDVILAAYENFDSLRKPESFKYFLFGIARNIFRKRLSRNKIRERFDILNRQHQYDAGSELETNVDIGLLYEKMDLLPTKQKEALILFEISGFALKEIQEIQGDSLSAVKLRLSRGREKLKELLSDTVIKL